MEQRIRILVVDDEKDLTSNIADSLERAGFQALTAEDGEDALRKVASFEPDIIILDILMPKLDGREVLRRLRRQENWAYIVMLSSVTAVEEHIQAFYEGADGYIDKPFNSAELIAYLSAVLKRIHPTESGLRPARKFVCGPLTLDRQRRKAYMGRKDLGLGPKILAILDYLMLRAGQVVDVQELLDAIWGADEFATPGSIYSKMTSLRKALNDDVADPRYIETTKQGYCFIGKVEGRM